MEQRIFWTLLQDGDEEVQKCKSAFVEQVQVLLKDNYEKEKFVKVSSTLMISHLSCHCA